MGIEWVGGEVDRNMRETVVNTMSLSDGNRSHVRE
mgnify:CR=1 FL=1